MSSKETSDDEPPIVKRRKYKMYKTNSNIPVSISIFFTNNVIIHL